MLLQFLIVLLRWRGVLDWNWVWVWMPTWLPLAALAVVIARDRLRIR